MRFVIALHVCLFSAATALPGAAQTPAAFEKPAAPGQLIDVGGGRRLHLLCKGDAEGPSVILEAGLSQYPAVLAFGKAQETIAEFARVCLYDRAGLGWSDALPGPRTHGDMADDLHRLLTAAKVPGPYVLVGHSIGGLLVRLYAQKYRDDVAGVVLADATSETIFDAESGAARVAIVEKIAKGLADTRPGVPVVALPAGTAPEIVISLLPETLRTVKEEYEAIDLSPAELRTRDGYGTLGALPLIVVRRGLGATPPSATDTSWRIEQEHLLTLSTNSQMVVAAKSGHVIPYDEPDVIADTVRRVIDAWRAAQLQKL